MASVNTIINITDNISRTLGSIQTAATRTKGALDDIGTSATGTEDQLNKFSFATFIANAEDAGKKISSIGRNMTLALTAPLVMLGKKLYDASTDHKTAYVGMTKTVEGTAEQYEHLNQVAREISENTPMNYVDVMGTMQTGGNLGVQVDQMEAFARSYAALESATDKKIAGETGAELVADFLTIMEGGVDKIEPFGSSIVHLGNNFNATEDKILSMGKRIAAAAVLANFTTPQVLGMATAFNAVGIEAEAGGSAASKLIKQMQLSAEVGVKAQQAFGGEFANAVDFQNYLATLKKADVVAIAEDMGTTVEHVQSMADSWLSLEQFASVSGKTADQFVKDWKNNPAQGMMDFFYGLNKMDTSGVESTLAMLDKMGITEVRQSNLVAAMASKPELFAAALTAAVKGYEENTAMWAEFEKQTDTQAAQNQMLANKLDNSMADLGDNVVKAVQPALDKVNELLDAFNKLSEADQDKIVNTFMVFAVGGPIVMAIGGTITAISNIAKGVNWIITSAPAWGTKLTAFFNNPAFWGVTAGGAILLLIGYLDSIPSKVESIVTDLSNIKITVDEESVNQTLAAIQKVQKAADLLSGGKVTEEAINTSEAVKMGYGTSTMYGTALGFEAKRAEAEINNIVTDYTAQIRAAEQSIVNAQTDAERAAGLATVQKLESDMDSAVKGARSRYTQTVSALFNGMAKQYPEQAAKLETAAKQYDVLSGILEYENRVDSYDLDYVLTLGEPERIEYENNFDAEVRQIQEQILRGLGDLGYINYEEQIANMNMGTPWLIIMHGVQEKLLEDMKNGVSDLSKNPVMAGLLQSILSDTTITENLDFTGLQGALDGIAGLLDFKQAADKAVESGKPAEFGQYLVLGLGQGVTNNAGLIAPSFTAVRDAALAALQAAFLMHSPSQLMAQQGVFIPQGLAIGITNGAPVVMAAISVIGGQMIAAFTSVGNAMISGMVSGLMSGQGRVVAAAKQLALSAYNAAKSALGIKSPSRLFAELGEYSGEGYVGGLVNTYSMVGKAVHKMMDFGAEPVWNLIDNFNKLELDDMLDTSEDKELRVSETDMRKVRELAEREVINRFTTANLKVEFTANNTIKSDLDLDGIVTHLETLVEDTLMAAAEGVHV